MIMGRYTRIGGYNFAEGCRDVVNVARDGISDLGLVESLKLLFLPPFCLKTSFLSIFSLFLVMYATFVLWNFF
jgi:hypothetical protein